ncbi:transmembrane and ubiquitin-like domain-containing protein 2 [Rhinophrynus dorsalis]
MGMESPPPTMIEGLGDEVTVAVGIFILLLALTLAWLSTYVAEGNDPFLGSLMPTGRRDPLLGLRNPVPPNPEPQGPVQPQAEKPEEAEQGSGGEEGAGSENANIDSMLNIQGMPKRSQTVPPLREGNTTVQECVPEDGGEQESPQDVVKWKEEGHGKEKVTKQQRMQEADREQECDKDSTEQECDKDSTEPERTQPEEGLMTVRLKFLNETEEVALVRPDDTVGMLKSKYFPGQEQQMKLFFLGQLLHDSSQTLCSLHITDNCVIHCHRSQATIPSSPAGPESGATSPENTALTPPVRNLMIPVFVVMLALIWYFRINYRQFFTAPATVSLVGVTVLLTFSVFGMYGR